jgi:hypothetical protein
MHGLIVARAFQSKYGKSISGGMNKQITLDYSYLNCYENDEPIFTES